MLNPKIITLKIAKQLKINKLKDLAMARRKNKNKNKNNSTTPKEVIRVAVYGTLMSNLNLNGILGASPLLGIFQTPPTLQMFSNGGYPYIMENGVTSVTMEVYQLTGKKVLEELDRVEGVSGGLYRRKELPTPYGTAFVYIRDTRMSTSCPPIPSGNWKQYVKKRDEIKLMQT